jgi:serine/threonine protein kinase
LHGDLKSANILLGPDRSAKVSDFGCSMITSAVEIGQVVKSTLGYLDPEYLLMFELTDKSDVYSFVVIILELLTRKKVISKEECLASVFQEALKKGKHGELLDSEIIDDHHNMHVVHQMAQLAAQCLVMPAEHRPSMREVAEELRLLEGVVQQSPGVPFHSEATRSARGSIKFQHIGILFWGRNHRLRQSEEESLDEHRICKMISNMQIQYVQAPLFHIYFEAMSGYAGHMFLARR